MTFTKAITVYYFLSARERVLPILIPKSRVLSILLLKYKGLKKQKGLGSNINDHQRSAFAETLSLLTITIV